MIAIHAEDTRGGLAGALARGGLLVTADELVHRSAHRLVRRTPWSEPAPYPVDRTETGATGWRNSMPI